MMGAISVLAGVGMVCASGIVVSSALKFFHTYEYDLTAKIKESKKEEARNNGFKGVTGGGEHANHIEGLSNRTSKRR